MTGREADMMWENTASHSGRAQAEVRVVLDWEADASKLG